MDHVQATLEFMQKCGLSLHALFIGACTPNNAKRRSHFASAYAGPTGRDNLRSLLDLLLRDVETRACTSEWISQSSNELLRKELLYLTDKSAGFHFNARNVSTSDITGFAMETLAIRLRDRAPGLWGLISILLDASGARAKRFQKLTQSVGNAIEPPDLQTTSIDSPDDDLYWAEFDGLSDEELMGIARADAVSGDAVTRRQLHAITRHSALHSMRTVAIISIMMQSSNGRCNGLQSILGFFLQSRNAPEAVIEVYAHIGLSVSPSTIQLMVTSLVADNRRAILRLSLARVLNLAYDNLNLGFKTSQATLEKQSLWFNVTSATYLAVLHCVPSDLMVSAELWAKSSLNFRREGDLPTFRMSYSDIVKLLPPAAYPRKSIFPHHIRRILVTHVAGFFHFRPNLGDRPEGTADPDLDIPVAPTTQYPTETMRIDESTPDAQGAILSELLNRAGYKDRLDELAKYVMLVHGDLGTLEKVDSLIQSRRVEETAANRLQWVIAIPGMFHIKMAAADALWRIYIEPFVSLPDPSSIFSFASKLRPRESVKIGSKPTYRQLHDVIQHVTAASILDCWTIVAKELGHDSLESFAASRPTWETIVQLSETITERFVATENFDEERFMRPTERDERFENGKLWHRDALLYIELCDASSHGHIGRIEKVLAFWVFIFAAVGKHKYAAYLSRFLVNLREVLPPQTARAVRMNWLCNPTGRKDGFRGVDWLLELNNMLQKTIHSGDSSNRTLDHIIKHSSLIELYRTCLSLVERNFHLTHRHTRHQPPDMTRTIRALREHISSTQVHSMIPGTKGKAIVPNKLTDGMDKLQRSKQLTVKLDGVSEDQPIVLDDFSDLADLVIDW